MKYRFLLSQLIFIAMGIVVPIFAWAQTPDLSMTPYRIVNKLNGLCVQYNNSNPESYLYQTAACDNSDGRQKFYFLDATRDKGYIPQHDGPVALRILIAGAYDVGRAHYAHEYLSLASASAFGSRISSDAVRYINPFPPAEDRAYWMFARTGGAQTLLNTQFEGLIVNQSTGMCMSYANHSPAVGTAITVGPCGNQDVWRLVPTPYWRE